MKAEIIRQLEEKIIADFLMEPRSSLDFDEPLISSGLIDSFNLVDFALFIEDTYHVIIDDTELNANAFDSLNELVDLIVSKLG